MILTSWRLTWSLIFSSSDKYSYKFLREKERVSFCDLKPQIVIKRTTKTKEQERKKKEEE